MTEYDTYAYQAYATWILDRGVDYEHAHKINSEIAKRSDFTMAAASWLTQ